MSATDEKRNKFIECAIRDGESLDHATRLWDACNAVTPPFDPYEVQRAIRNLKERDAS